MVLDANNPFVLIGIYSAILLIVIVAPAYSAYWRVPLRWLCRGRGVVPPVAATAYEPPEGITPAEAATLIDEGVSPRAILATIVDLAMRGYIKIEHMEDPGYDFKGYPLTLLKSGPALKNLASFERVLLERLFFSGTVMDLKPNAKTTLSAAGSRIVGDVSLIEREIHRSLEAKGLYVRSGDWDWVTPEIRKNGTVFERVVSYGLVFMFFVTFLAFQSDGWLLGIFATVLWLGLLYAYVNSTSIARRFMSKTSRGRIKRAECQSFKDFLERVDGDRLKRMPPETIEKYIPYAMAFGLEQKWSEEFDDLTNLSNFFSL